VLGFAVPQFGGSAHLDVGELARFASTAEQLGADSLWVGDRLLAAVNPTVGYVGTDTVPEQFRTNLDPFIALTVAATVTTTAQLGSSVFVAPWYPPVPLARQLTSIDVISGGRLLPGFGIGWSPEEYQAAGAPFRRRGAQLDELLDALDALWTVNPVRLDGERWSIPESWVNLKPVQRPRPPVYLGAFNPAGLKRVGERADGWMPAWTCCVGSGRPSPTRPARRVVIRRRSTRMCGSTSPKAPRWTRSPTPCRYLPTTDIPTRSST
jgi:probable F420-dependent oxidoreductase